MDIPGDLIKQIKAGKCVAFVGAGLSQAAKLPGWPDLLRRIIKWAEVHLKDYDAINSWSIYHLRKL